MIDYYVTLDGGNCSLVRASSEQLAKDYATKLFGTIMTPRIRKATPSEVSWVEAMGGRIYEAN